MKRIILFLTAMMLLVRLYSQSIKITGGSYDGELINGGRVYVLANICPTGTVFDHWTGNVALKDSFSILTSFTMTGKKKVVLTALFKPATVWSPVITTINGTQVYYYFPPGIIKGLITFYHGSGGSASNWFTDEFEKPFLQYAVEEGYAVFSADCKDRTGKKWDLSGVNSVDLVSMGIMFSTLKSLKLIKNNTPIFGIGMSDGSMFCSMIAQIDNFAACALYCAAGQTKSIQQTTSPTQWCMSVDDTTMSPNMMSQAQSNYQTLAERGIAAQFLIHYANPVFPTIFAQQQSFGWHDSWNVYNSLKSAGMLNSRDFITIDPLKVKPWEKLVPGEYSSKDNFIEGQLTAAAAEHRFHNYFEHKTIQFFDTHGGNKNNLSPSVFVADKLFPGISVFPNPATDHFTIESSSSMNSVAVINTMGKMVKQLSPNSMSCQFSCSDLSKGIYFIEIRDENGNTFTRKIMVNH